ncbi:MAG: DUF4129 domain-containing protein [Xanthomonadaceae bacterium]|jgi:hypothetical protein|nr:DUF4129 domain-containing protein [Xanthomonadaceae bacterium]
MQLDRLTVHLRQRTSWEAMELGTALVRRNATAIWRPWLLATWPAWFALHLLGWWAGAVWLAGLAMWWLKPAFDRIPLYVISRGVFGDTPGTWQTLRGHIGWGWGSVFAYLLWRRFGPARSLFLPVDLLEGGSAQQRRRRRRTLGGAVYGQMLLLTTVFLHFELVLTLACVAAVALFVPAEYLSRTLRTAWALLGAVPVWMAILLDAIAWIAVTVLEPFYVGAGFGMYLNRRTELEAWDVELTFRKLRKRLTAAATPFALLLALSWMPWQPASAQTGANEAGGHVETGRPSPRRGGTEAAARRAAAGEAKQERTLREVFGADWRDPAPFRDAAEQTFEHDPLLSAKRKVVTWEERNPDKENRKKRNWNIPGMDAIAGLFAFLGKWGLWLLLGMALVVVLVLARHWLPWMRGSGKRAKKSEGPVRVETLASPEKLPDDIVDEARRLWAAGKPRHALALLYRASVATMAVRAQVILPPGATEAQCLRASRRMPEAEDRDLFARMVRIWEYAAYAWQLPDAATFDRLVDELRQRYAWGRA